MSNVMQMTCYVFGLSNATVSYVIVPLEEIGNENVRVFYWILKMFIVMFVVYSNKVAVDVCKALC